VLLNKIKGGLLFSVSVLLALSVTNSAIKLFLEALERTQELVSNPTYSITRLITKCILILFFGWLSVMLFGKSSKYWKKEH
jgi:hypothetical protein